MRLQPYWKHVLGLGLLVCSLSALDVAGAVGKASVKEYDQVFTTYPYSDPDPVPTMSRFYPYFRFDGYTDQPVRKKWKVVELSNDYLRVLILPEIGGKVWAAVERATGKPFIYYNHVVKFRDVSMRGPWTSGGMEPNYGIIGHTPNCFSRVDYVARRNPDGSASCIIGTLDLLTRTTWRLEISLPANEACFITRSFWHNGSGAEQPYYSWMNVGIKAGGNLQFINPGTHYLDHEGRAYDWPINPANGRNISWYEQNDFGSYKSYHVFGRFAEFFGGYYHDEDFGMARCSAYGDKPGRKIWIWGLSRQGMIWENLLTDTDGQYVEVQSGRLFNQASGESSLTPFKNREFPPYATDTWTEYWQPVKGIKGFVSASPWGALNISREKDQLVIRISPARSLRDKLEVFDGDRLLWSSRVSLKPMHPVQQSVRLAAEPKALKVRLGGDKLRYEAGEEDVLSRPVEAPTGFDGQTDYGHYLKGKESARQRDYGQAESELEACLKRNPHFAPALVEMAALANRRAAPDKARDFARRALSIDTYDPGANYQFGIASASLGHNADAKDAFSVAGLSAAWRGAAQTELAKVYLREEQYDRALACANASLDCNRRNLDAIQLQACIARLTGDGRGAEAARQALLSLDPLNHFTHFERYLSGTADSTQFALQLRSEFPHETCLELAAWYRNAGLGRDGARVLEIAPPTAETLYWLAYLRRDTNVLARAEAASPSFVFPFRIESIPVFEWAIQQSRAWQARYYLALVRWHLGDLERARRLLAECGDEPAVAPFYAARAQVAPDKALRDLERAAQLDPTQWRYGSMLVRWQLDHKGTAAALASASDCARRFPENTAVALLRGRALLLSGDYAAAAAILDSLKLLPSEGRTDARNLFREVHLMLALEQMKAGAFDRALAQVTRAREWPERLGAGEPYAEDLDERLEDWLVYQCALKRDTTSEARSALDRVLTFGSRTRPTSASDIIRALALKESGQTAEAEKFMDDWLARDPSSEIARWGVEVLHSRPASAPADSHDPAVRVLSAWLSQANRP